jgi:ATP-dependent helicase/nuclease subunit A
MDLMALGRVLLLPEDDLSLACVLKGPLIGLDEDHLFALAQTGGRSLWARARRDGEGRFCLCRSARSSRSSPRGPTSWRPSSSTRPCWAPGAGREKLLARLGPDAADPLDEFLSLALSYERENAPSLEGFLHWLSAGELEIKRDLEQEPARSA